MKSAEYLAGKMEGMEKDIVEIREDLGALRKQVWNNTKWILLATGFLTALVFVSHAIEWYIKLGGGKL